MKYKIMKHLFGLVVVSFIIISVTFENNSVTKAEGISNPFTSGVAGYTQVSIPEINALDDRIELAYTVVRNHFSDVYIGCTQEDFQAFVPVESTEDEWSFYEKTGLWKHPIFCVAFENPYCIDTHFHVIISIEDKVALFSECVMMVDYCTAFRAKKIDVESAVLILKNNCKQSICNNGLIYAHFFVTSDNQSYWLIQVYNRMPPYSLYECSYINCGIEAQINANSGEIIEIDQVESTHYDSFCQLMFLQ